MCSPYRQILRRYETDVDAHRCGIWSVHHGKGGVDVIVALCDRLCQRRSIQLQPTCAVISSKVIEPQL